MDFKLKKRKYNCIDFLRIPFTCSPFCSTLVLLQKVLTALANVFQVIATAGFIDAAISYVSHEVEFNAVLYWFIFMAVLIAWKRVSWNIGRIFLRKVEIYSNEKLRREMTAKIGRLEYNLIEDADTRKLINRVCDKVDKHISEMFQRTLNLILYIIRIVGVLIILFSQTWWLGAIVLVLIVPLMIISFRSGKKVYKADKEFEEFDRRTIYLQEVLAGRDSANERTLFEYSDYVGEQWHDQFTKGRKVKFKAQLAWVLGVNKGSAFTSVISSIIIVIMVPFVANGTIAFSMFIALATAIYDIVKLMGIEMTRVVTQLSKYNSYMKDFTKFANLPEDEDATALPAICVPKFELLEIKNLSFKYPNTDRLILENLNLTIEANKHYAFVGENGAGKTTIIKILTGLYNDYEGEILINHKNIKEYKKSEIKAIFSGVYQDFAKYSIPVKENITIGDMNNMDDLERAKEMAKLVDIDDQINSLKYGYETKIGKLDDESIDLSGGQWQRIAMARALMSSSEVKILDEPTAALDPISESNLYKEFEKISAGKTTIFISHRLGSIKLADYVYVIHNGSIIEKGTHDELIAINGMYKEMYESQKGWYVGGAE